jgi:hypothetical protein
MSRPRSLLFGLLGSSVLALTVACAPTIRATTEGPRSRAPLADLWEDPTDLTTRDLFWGPWGQRFAPPAHDTYRVLDVKTTGFSRGFSVEDAHGQQWSVKQGPEAHVEVVVSRILSAVGYHQPPVYYVESWTKVGGPGDPVQGPARFRRKGIGLKEVSDWSWQQNPFVGTAPYGGLLSLLMLLNGTDLKNTNNSLYDVAPTLRVSTARRWYVVRDVGAALGETGKLEPRRGDPVTFAKIGFLQSITDGRVQFTYRGRHQELVKDLSTTDLAWMIRLVSRLSDRQWRDAFRAGGYGPSASELFISTIKAKLAESRCTVPRATSTPSLTCVG